MAALRRIVEEARSADVYLMCMCPYQTAGGACHTYLLLELARELARGRRGRVARGNHARRGASAATTSPRPAGARSAGCSSSAPSTSGPRDPSTRTAALAGGRDEELAWVDMTRGALKHDTGDHAAAGELLPLGRRAVGSGCVGQPLAMALTMLGRFHFLRGEIEDALHVLDQALDEVDARGMTAFVSWPESFRGELDLLLGDVDPAEDQLRARVRPRVPGRRRLLGERRRACQGLVANSAWGRGPRTRPAGRRAEAVPPPAGHVPLDRGLRARCSLRGRRRARRRGRPALDRRARGDHRAARHRGAPPARDRLPVAAWASQGALEAARSLATQIDNPSLDELLGVELSVDAA